MENGCDFLDRVSPDMSACVFRHLDDPADLIRASSVSRSWNKFVISNSFTKDLSVRLCPEVSNLESKIENDHQIYARLLQNLVSDRETKNCTSQCIGATSMYRLPYELIEISLEDDWFSYSSSKGKEDSDKSETLTYRLVSDLCIVDEIKIQSWFAAYHDGGPIHSAKFVRFKIGCSKINRSLANDDDDFVWIYTSPKFSMQQENMLQTFKLPRPVLCIGGIVQIEFLGRPQRRYKVRLDYVCASHVEVIGRPVSRLALSRIVSDPAASDFLIKYSISEAEIDK